MRRFLLSLAILSLGTSLAMAQDHGRGGGHEGGPRGEDRGGGEHGGNRGGPRPEAQSGRGPIGERTFREHHDAPSPQRMQDNDRRNDNRRGPEMREDRDRGRPDFDRRGFNNGDRGRRDFSGVRNFHQNFRSERRFHAPIYRRPPGFYFHRWTWGEYLPPAFWVRDYWLLDFGLYDLPPPPFGAIWVRVGDDALLIDRFTGEIIEVDYGVFY